MPFELRTFRDAQTRLWSEYKPTELASPEAFERDPKLVWDWYAMRREKVREVEPNPGHFALMYIVDSAFYAGIHLGKASPR